MKKKRSGSIIAADEILIIWLALALILFSARVTMFIIPALFLVAVFYELARLASKRIPTVIALRLILWYICLTLFSYLGVVIPQAKLFFPILCLTLAISMMLIPMKRTEIFNRLYVPVLLMCCAVVYYFSFWPIGLIAIGISLIHIIAYSILKKRKASKEVSKKGQKVEVMHELKQEEQNLPAAPEYQVPGQQYQPLMPEYDRSFGAYIQDLPPDQ